MKHYKQSKGNFHNFLVNGIEKENQQTKDFFNLQIAIVIAKV